MLFMYNEPQKNCYVYNERQKNCYLCKMNHRRTVIYV
jgi:hypothetical protein